jgi:PAS domain S-box-containing protein
MVLENNIACGSINVDINFKGVLTRLVVPLLEMVLFFFLFSLSVSMFLFGNEPYLLEDKIRFEIISIDGGLSQSTVRCIIQDKRGLMWFGTEDGLNRYDGYEFVIYRPIPDNPTSLSDEGIHCLYEDHQGHLWIGTRQGLNRFNRDNETFTRYQKNTDTTINGLTGNEILAICQTPEGDLWIGTGDGGLNKFVVNENRFYSYQQDITKLSSITSNQISTLYVDHLGMLWIGTRDAGLNRFDVENNGFVHYQNSPGNPTSLSGNTVTAIVEDRDGNLWVGTNSGLNKLDREKFIFTRYNHNPRSPYNPKNISSDLVRCICLTHSGELFIGTEEGLDEFNTEDETFTHYQHDPDDPHSLSNNIIISFYEDSSHILWIGTEGGGFNKFAANLIKFTHYYENSHKPQGHLQGKFVYSFCEDSKGVIWIGTNKGLNRFEPRTRTHSFTCFSNNPDDPHSLSNNFVFSIYEDRSGILWLGTWGGGLNKFNRQTGQFTYYLSNPKNPISLSSNIVLDIYEDRQGMFWIGTKGGGLNKFDREKEAFIHYRSQEGNPGSLSSDNISTIYEDRSGGFWIGTSHGLNKFDRITGNCIRYTADTPGANGLNNNSVTVIHESSSGMLWIGTGGGGLNQLHPLTNQFSYYTSQDGLPNNIINGIVEDDQGNLWISTNQGIAKFNPRDRTCRSYQVKDGLQSSEFVRGAYVKNRKGEMFFGGVNGFNLFHPDQIKDNPFIPPIIFTDFKILNQSVALVSGATQVKAITEAKCIKLTHKDYVFSFEFAALDYSYPPANRYAYKMEGIEEKWVYSGTRRFASYSTLAPGTYKFSVKGTNSDGVWNEPGTSMRIVIIPPFYQSWWFRIIIAVGILFFILGIYRYRIHTIRKRNRELEAFNVKLQQHIKERKEAEEQVMKSERRLRTFLETTSEGLLEVDNNEVILDVNPDMCSILGRSQEDLVGKYLFDFISHEDMDTFRKQLEIRKEGIRSSYSLTMLRPDHKPVHCLINAAPLFDENKNKRGSFAMVTNITIMIKAEKELQHTKNFLDSVFNSIPSLLITVSREGTITQWNSAAEKYFAIPARAAVSRKLFAVVPFLEDYQHHMTEVFNSKTTVDLHRESVAVEKLWQDKKDEINNKYRNLNKNKSKDRDKVYLDILMSPLVTNTTYNYKRGTAGKMEVDKVGEVEGIVIRLEDVTELVWIDRQLIQAQKMETVGNLAGGLAHDFNNVLGGIVGTTSLIKFMLENGKYIDLDEIKSRLSIIEKGTDRAVDLVRQLLTLSRKAEPSLAAVNLNHSLNHVIKICENTFDKSIKIIPHYYYDQAMVWADATQIEQVLLNLCVNASHAMTLMRNKSEPQGGTLTVSIMDFIPDRRFFSIHPAAVNKKYWHLKVKDTGVGMNATNLAKIFDPFFTTKAKSKGTGLGLAMVYNIIRQHKGFIDVYSQPKEGSIFNVFLPQLQPEQQEFISPLIKRDGKPIKGAGLILVVDDEESLLRSTKEMLENCGYEVITAKDGKEGVDIFREKCSEIKVVLLDLVMPNMSGKEAYIEIKKIHPEVRALLTTGFREDQRVKEALKLGINAFIQKPFSMVELSRIISEVIHS